MRLLNDARYCQVWRPTATLAFPAKSALPSLSTGYKSLPTFCAFTQTFSLPSAYSTERFTPAAELALSRIAPSCSMFFREPCPLQELPFWLIIWTL